MGKVARIAKKKKEIPEESLQWVDKPPWCEALEGRLRCRVCGSVARIGGELVDEEGRVRRRKMAPQKWFTKHSTECGGRQEVILLGTDQWESVNGKDR